MGLILLAAIGLPVIIYLIRLGNNLLFSRLSDGLQRRAVERDRQQRHRDRD